MIGTGVLTPEEIKLIAAAYTWPLPIFIEYERAARDLHPVAQPENSGLTMREATALLEGT